MSIVTLNVNRCPKAYANQNIRQILKLITFNVTLNNNLNLTQTPTLNLTQTLTMTQTLTLSLSIPLSSQSPSAVIAQHITLPYGLNTTLVPTHAHTIITLVSPIRDPND